MEIQCKYYTYLHIAYFMCKKRIYTYIFKSMNSIKCKLNLDKKRKDKKEDGDMVKIVKSAPSPECRKRNT